MSHVHDWELILAAVVVIAGFAILGIVIAESVWRGFKVVQAKLGVRSAASSACWELASSHDVSARPVDLPHSLDPRPRRTASSEPLRRKSLQSISEWKR